MSRGRDYALTIESFYASVRIMTLAERLRELRTQRGWRLKDLSEKSGLSVPYLSDLERGRTNPSLETLQTLAASYGLSVNDLLAPVDFYGERTPASLPKGLAELIADPQLGAEITPEWQQTLSRIELRGKRPESKRDWYEIYLHLKRVLEG
ncbi:HTH-type transcriptional regulator DdrOP3 [Meiothermus luteus]|uniref:HTH-type transcriptional regulator DdrOP3 n=2 Tax=Meiothermus luteus TaxID=2026184 RepID=A0A399F4Y9_9DEIN|nr:HTH-type transcriptional regulator DdrOP3 [Meiothermus luteus]